ncbi:hypothetical protein KBZ21_40970, partial [Streptomyces sp. A73]|nr:hypothetical protein [Streptomyces sp. A73]
MDRATKAGFPAKNPNYKTQPQNMLLARATAECARLSDIAKRTSDWDRFLVEQAVWMLGLQQDEFSANDMRELLP